MKKRLLLLAAALAIIVMGIGSTISYFNSKDTADNVFTVGGVEIEISEPGWKENEEHIIAPNEGFDKDPRVENTGDNDAYVRVHVSIPNYENVAKALVKGNTDNLGVLFQGEDSENWTKGETPKKSEDGSITYTYTYNKVLTAGETTSPVFTSVLFPETVDMDAVIALKGDGIEINISADAIQAEGFADAGEAFSAFDNEG